MRESFKDLTDQEYAELIWSDSMKSLAFIGSTGRRVYFIKTRFFGRIKQVKREKFFKR